MTAPGRPGRHTGDPLAPPAGFADALNATGFPDTLAGLVGGLPGGLAYRGGEFPDCLRAPDGPAFDDVLSTPLPRPAPAGTPSTVIAAGSGPAQSALSGMPAEPPLTVPSTRVSRPARSRPAALPAGRSRRPDRVELPTWLPDRAPAPRHRRPRSGR